MKHQLYRHFDAAGNLLYVGVSYSATKRLWEHRSRSFWFESIASVKTVAFSSRAKAEAAERKAILEERPLYNVRHSSDPAEAQRLREEQGGLAQIIIWITPEQRLALKQAALDAGRTMQDIAATAVLAEVARLGH